MFLSFLYQISSRQGQLPLLAAAPVVYRMTLSIATKVLQLKNVTDSLFLLLKDSVSDGVACSKLRRRSSAVNQRKDTNCDTVSKGGSTIINKVGGVLVFSRWRCDNYLEITLQYRWTGTSGFTIEGVLKNLNWNQEEC